MAVNQLSGGKGNLQKTPLQSTHPYHFDFLGYAWSWGNWGSKILAVTFLNLYLKFYVKIDIQLNQSFTFYWLIYLYIIGSNMNILPAQVYEPVVCGSITSYRLTQSHFTGSFLHILLAHSSISNWFMNAHISGSYFMNPTGSNIHILLAQSSISNWLKQAHITGSSF